MQGIGVSSGAMKRGAFRLTEDEYRRIAGVIPEPLLRKSESIARGPNKTETRFIRDVLEPRQRAGEIQWWRYEPFSIRLAQRTHYRPDFLVWFASGERAFFEIKGAYVWDKALNKPKVCAEMFPCFPFYLAQWKQGRWHIRPLPAREVA